VRQKLCGLNSLNGVIYQTPEFLPLFIGDRGPQVLNLDQSFANEYHLGDFSNASHPRVTNQLRIQRQ
jgi:hypothetical protein